MMATVSGKQKIIAEIANELKYLDKMEIQILLTRLRVKRMLRNAIKPVARYDSRKVKLPSMDEIDKWKHTSRKA